MRLYFIPSIENEEDFRLSFFFFRRQELTPKKDFRIIYGILNLFFVVCDQLFSFDSVEYFRLIFFVVNLVIGHEVSWLNGVMLLEGG